ncbi:trimeric intracellular cation channel family protein [Campylobacter majalis]|uniref:trimeric intracellular cation channel family protein n=1 Tax=Campylobacter majalis TaxID=2790656 RepID=UPI003D68EFF8
MDFFVVVESIGMASASISGYLFAVKKGCDWLGVFVAAFLTALGGGVLRDVLVGRDIYSFTHYMPCVIVLVMIVVANRVKLYSKKERIEKKFVFIFTDAVDVICFSIVGAIVASEHGYNVFGVALIAFSNGVGGGILRDILLNEVPWFLSTGLYGTISIVVGVLYYAAFCLGFSSLFFTIFLLIFGIIFRLLAYYRGWSLPLLKD